MQIAQPRLLLGRQATISYGRPILTSKEVKIKLELAPASLPRLKRGEMPNS